MAPSNCPKCGAPAPVGANNCDYCGAAILPAAVSGQAPAQAASTQEADAWLEKLSHQKLESFRTDYERVASRGDYEAALKWRIQWELWLTQMERDMPHPPAKGYKKRFNKALKKWKEALDKPWGGGDGEDDNWYWWTIAGGISLLLIGLAEC